METLVKLPSIALAAAFVVVAGAPSSRADDKKLDVRAILDKVVDGDPFGWVDTKIGGRAVLHDKNNAERILQFSIDALRYKPGLSKSMTRFSKPADIAGVGFLQVMRDDADDDRYLYLPDLKKSRRIAGALRHNSFMGTDLSYADLDLRDLRDCKAKLVSTEKIGKFDYWKIDVVPTRSDSQYSKFEMWVRTDNYLVLKWLMYDKSNVLLKTYQASEMKRVEGHWYANKSRIENHREKHTTDFYLDDMKPAAVAESEFTVGNLEKL